MRWLVDTLRKINFAELLQDQAKQFPDQTSYQFLKDGETQEASFTYAELDLRARAIAAQLQSLQRGDRALLIYPSGLEFIAAFFGCLYAGVVAVPAYPPRANQNGERLLAIAADAQATLVLTTSTQLAQVQSSFLEGQSALNWIATDQIQPGDAAGWTTPALNPNDLALLQYTSGATGTPKGVMITHQNLIDNAVAIQHCFQDTPESLGVSWLPMHHDMGLMGGVLQPLYIGRPMVLMSPTSFVQKPIRWLQAISAFQATTSGGPSFAFDLCLQKITAEQKAGLDLSRWRLAFNGAESIRAQTLKEFTDFFRECGFSESAFCACYGMAEATLIISGTIPTSRPQVVAVDGVALEQNRVQVAEEQTATIREIVSCGAASPDKILAIVEPTSGIRCAENEVGEIWVAGPGVAQGYWQRTEESSATFNGTLAEMHDQTFLRTGDLGFLKSGELYVTGRLKDVIIIRGRNHYPQDIEWAVQSSNPALRPGHCAAFSVSIESIERLVIVQEVERQSLRSLDSEAIMSTIRQRISEEFQLQVYAIILLKPGSLPKTSSGKIQRNASRAAYLDREYSSVGEWQEATVDVGRIQQSAAALLSKLQASSIQVSSTLQSDPVGSTASPALQAPPEKQTCEAIQLWIVANLALYLKVLPEEISPSEPFSNYGLDSTAAMSLSAELSDWLQTDLEPTIFWEHPTIESLAQFLSEKADRPSALP